MQVKHVYLIKVIQFFSYRTFVNLALETLVTVFSSYQGKSIRKHIQ